MTFNEIDLLPAYYRYIRLFCNEWIVLDHGSDDGTREYLCFLEKKGEIPIKLMLSDDRNFSGNFYEEYNKVLNKATGDFIFSAHIDEFCPRLPVIIRSLVNNKDKIFMFNRLDLVCLSPLIRINEPHGFARLWENGKLKFKIPDEPTVHKEDYIIKDKASMVFVPLPYYHLGQCRHINKIIEKEATYETVGKSILTSRYNPIDRDYQRVTGHVLAPDQELLDMIL